MGLGVAWLFSLYCCDDSNTPSIKQIGQDTRQPLDEGVATSHYSFRPSPQATTYRYPHRAPTPNTVTRKTCVFDANTNTTTSNSGRCYRADSSPPPSTRTSPPAAAASATPGVAPISPAPSAGPSAASLSATSALCHLSSSSSSGWVVPQITRECKGSPKSTSRSSLGGEGDEEGGRRNHIKRWQRITRRQPIKGGDRTAVGSWGVWSHGSRNTTLDCGITYEKRRSAVGSVQLSRSPDTFVDFHLPTGPSTCLSIFLFISINSLAVDKRGCPRVRLLSTKRAIPEAISAARTALYRRELHDTALHCTALHCIAADARSSHLIVPATICCVGCPRRASPTHCESGPYTPSHFLASTSSNCSNAVPTFGRNRVHKHAKAKQA